MAKSTTVRRPLASITREAVASSWRWSGKKSAIGSAARGLYEFLYIPVTMAVRFVWIPLLVLFLAAGVATDHQPYLRLLAAEIVACVFAACAFLQFLDIQIHAPRADKSYPVMTSCSECEEHLCAQHGGLALWAGLLAVLLLMCWYGGVQAQSGSGNTLMWGLINAGLATAMQLYGLFPPHFGYFRQQGDEKHLAGTGAFARVFREGSMRPAPQASLTVTKHEPEYATPVQAREARTTFADIHGMSAVKERLLEPARSIVAARMAGAEPPANGILMHGEPGNGKTGFAEALAGELGVPIVTLTYGDVSSKWIGEMPRLIANCFAYAKQHAPCVLFVDEIDSFLRSRDSGSSNSEDQKITNTLLTEMVNVRNHPVALVGATNYLATLDAAAIREGRFDFKVEITPPDEPARIGLLRKAAAKYASDLQVDDEALLSVAKRWNGFSVSRLLAVGRELPKYAKAQGKTCIGFDDWLAALRLVQGSKGKPPVETKPLKDLILEADTREALELIAGRLKDAERIESMGGTLPSGILFHGPSGTGKTAAARALALECGWAFLSVAGPDLLADRQKLGALYAQACDLRPTLVFIDEADDVLRNRQFTTASDIVNRMLVLMDGSAEKVRDVVFIAATNNPKQIDPALLRAGRFTEKVEFFLPPADQVPRAIAGWLKAKRVSLEPGVDVFDAAKMLSCQSMANIEGILQYALNRAISRAERGTTAMIMQDDLAAAARIVAGQRQ